MGKTIQEQIIDIYKKNEYLIKTIETDKECIILLALKFDELIDYIRNKNFEIKNDKQIEFKFNK